MNKKIIGLFLVVVTFATTAAPSAYPLHDAALSGDVQEIERLLNDGECGIDDQDDSGRTALHWAAEGGQIECLRKLIAYDADIGAAANNGTTPLHQAAFWGHFECLKELVARKADVEARSSFGRTPLHSAACGGKLACVEYLVYEAGAVIDVKNHSGKTPKDVAAEFGRQDVVKFFENYQELPIIKGTEIGSEVLP